MTKARDLANLLGGGTSGVATFGGTAAIRVPNGTTAQRPTAAPGMIRYNTTTESAEVYDGNIWAEFGAPPPSISAVSPSTYNGESGTTFTIDGANFTAEATVFFITSGGTEVQAATVSFVSGARLTATTPQDFTVADEPLDVKVVQASGQASKLDAIDCGGVPAWSTASGSLGTCYDAMRDGYYVDVLAGDPDSGATVAYSLVSGSLPSGMSLNSATGRISGTPSAVGSDTTSNFTLRATDNAGNTTDRAFSITVKAPIVVTFTHTASDQTFTLPAGANKFVCHIWGAGGGCYRNPNSYRGGGGGYTTGKVAASNGASFVVVVGAGGASRTDNEGTVAKRYGGGGQLTTLGWGGQGGGLSGVFTGTSTVFSGNTPQSGAHARSVLIAGGGGGGGDVGWGGSGGGTSGRNAYTGGGAGVAGYGAGLQTDSNNGFNGATQKGGQLYGGDASGGDQGGGGGGGAGYYGGGGGSGENGVPNSGGGGSGYIGGASGATVSDASTAQGTDYGPGGIGTTYFNSSYGYGAISTTASQDGRVVIVY